jgi:putative signal transducing protein
MNRVFIAHDPIEAHFVASLLKNEGIDAEVQGESLFGLRPEIGFSHDTLPSVWIVEESQLAEALKLVGEFERDKKAES